jgi:hypothetical protein
MDLVAEKSIDEETRRKIEEKEINDSIVNMKTLDFKNFIMNKCFKNDFSFPKEDLALKDKKIFLKEPIPDESIISTAALLSDFTTITTITTESNSNELVSPAIEKQIITSKNEKDDKNDELNLSTNNKMNTTNVILSSPIHTQINNIIDKKDNSEKIIENEDGLSEKSVLPKRNRDYENENLTSDPDNNDESTDEHDSDYELNLKNNKRKKRKITNENRFDGIEEICMQKLKNDLKKDENLFETSKHSIKVPVVSFEDSYCFNETEFLKIIDELSAPRSHIQKLIFKLVSYCANVFVDLLSKKYFENIYTEETMKPFKYGIANIIYMYFEERFTQIFESGERRSKNFLLVGCVLMAF